VSFETLGRLGLSILVSLILTIVLNLIFRR